MIRGEIWTVAGSVYSSKPRPSPIIQDARFEPTVSVTVLPLTSSLVDAPLLRIAVQPSELSGLQRESQVERALLAFLGIA